MRRGWPAWRENPTLPSPTAPRMAATSASPDSLPATAGSDSDASSESSAVSASRSTSRSNSAGAAEEKRQSHRRAWMSVTVPPESADDDECDIRMTSRPLDEPLPSERRGLPPPPVHHSLAQRGTRAIETLVVTQAGERTRGGIWDGKFGRQEVRKGPPAWDLPGWRWRLERGWR